ncbi:hypothetical protein P8H27_11300 [Pseudomonas sp. sp1636]|uniref:hypothetical protein n=1 Tax=Pseudomonas sp. sp1636 TaxID=3036707 RepID=UPI0025A56298|nr:hypothetical protein [Pseudomonas sp. sp1636]MDM8349480.1 hypothetical protein [Pseudomonas sp. sp1636]
MPVNPPISVIIPCWQDTVVLEQLLSRLNQLAQRSRQELQLIVVDAAGCQTCRQLCLQYEAQWIPADPCKGRNCAWARCMPGIRSCGFCMPTPSYKATHYPIFKPEWLQAR